MKAEVYKPLNSSYGSQCFCVLKKDGRSLRLVHSLEPLNEVTIAHSGVPPATETSVAQFTGQACGGMLDLYVGYDEWTLSKDSRNMGMETEHMRQFLKTQVSGILSGNISRILTELYNE